MKISDFPYSKLLVSLRVAGYSWLKLGGKVLPARDFGHFLEAAGRAAGPVHFWNGWVRWDQFENFDGQIPKKASACWWVPICFSVHWKPDA